MPQRITATELKAHLLAVLDRVAAGEEVEITRDGHTIARLLPARNSSKLQGSMARVAKTAPDATEEDLYQTHAPWERVVD